MVSLGQFKKYASPTRFIKVGTSFIVLFKLKDVGDRMIDKLAAKSTEFAKFSGVFKRLNSLGTKLGSLGLLTNAMSDIPVAGQIVSPVAKAGAAIIVIDEGIDIAFEVIDSDFLGV